MSRDSATRNCRIVGILPQQSEFAKMHHAFLRKCLRLLKQLLQRILTPVGKKLNLPFMNMLRVR